MKGEGEDNGSKPGLFLEAVVEQPEYLQVQISLSVVFSWKKLWSLFTDLSKTVC